MARGIQSIVTVPANGLEIGDILLSAPRQAVGQEVSIGEMVNVREEVTAVTAPGSVGGHNVAVVSVWVRGRPAPYGFGLNELVTVGR